MISIPPCRIDEWTCPQPLPHAEFATLRRRLVLDHFKWDPQVGDVETLARFPLVLPASVAQDLAAMAEALAAETGETEHEVLARPELLDSLAIRHAVRRVLSDTAMPLTPSAARVIRFDFHPTTDGWQISEANSDVPGGYTESSHFTRMMAERWPEYRPAGDPLAALADAICKSSNSGQVALLAAPGFMEDQQIIACLADAIRRRGRTATLARPTQLEWTEGQARLRVRDELVSVAVVVRFFQGEWLSLLPNSCWENLVRGGVTPVCNPGIAIIAESKRSPLIWNELKSPMSMWRALLPETRDPRAVRWRQNSDWILKAAFSNNGDDVADRMLNTRRDWRKAALAVRWRPGNWVVQRRFEALPIATANGNMYPCLGVYTVNGRAAGIYGRIAPRPFIDYSAIDIAVLIRD